MFQLSENGNILHGKARRAILPTKISSTEHTDDVHSNFNHWKTETGPLGTRVTRDHFAFLGGSYHRVTNNRAISDFVNPNSESFFVQFQTHRLVGQSFDSTDIQVNFNRYTHNTSTNNGESSYAFQVYDFDFDGQVDWPRNSELKNNQVDGSGQLRFHYWFRINNLGNNSGDPMGLQFDLQDNSIGVPFSQAEFRP